MRPQFALRRRGRVTECLARPEAQQVTVVVAGGYHPDVIHLEAGVPVRLVFRREESSPCSEQVIFPTLGKSASLPQHQDVPVDIMLSEAGLHDFTCAMGMMHGQLVVSPRRDGDRPGSGAEDGQTADRDDGQ